VKTINNHEDSNAELYRKQLLSQEATIHHLRSEVRKLEEAKYQAYKRINELTGLLNEARGTNIGTGG
jgi:septal ring factor EnvC (AmiA/AmiB activator)